VLIEERAASGVLLDKKEKASHNSAMHARREADATWLGATSKNGRMNEAG